MSAGRLLFPALRWSSSAGTHVPEGCTVAEALAAGVGGFIVFGGTAEATERLTRELRERAGRDLLFGADLERGAGQQFQGLTEWPPPAALAAVGPAAIASAAASTASEAREVGVNWVFAPVADLDSEPANPIVQTRAFGSDPRLVGQSVATWVRAAQQAGVHACAKHFPGHGRTRRDSHETVPEVGAGRAELAADLDPFRAAIEAGVSSVMTAHVRYPALDPTGLPATASPAVIRVLREELGFAGAAVTDALIMAGAGGITASAIVAAGVDALLYPGSLAEAMRDLTQATESGRLPAARLDEARGRLHRLLEERLPASRPPTDDVQAAAAACDALMAQPPLRGVLPKLRRPLELAVVDDDLGGPYPPTPSDWCEAALGPLAGRGGSRVVLVFAEPRGWKGRAGFSEAARTRLAGAAGQADLIVLFGHPRLASELPGSAPALLAWHRARPLQEAVARRLAGLLA